jgi:DNA replication protein DnaC
MDKNTEEILHKLRLNVLLEKWDEIIKTATTESPPYGKFLKNILNDEYEDKKLRAKKARFAKAKIPDPYTMNTYPFAIQPKLNKKQVLELYDSFNYIKNNQNIALIGPTGCGKTGLATSYLSHAIENDCHGRFILFSDLITELYQSNADHSTDKVMKKYVEIDCLVIDELGYIEIDEPTQAGLLFKMLRQRKKCTIITSNLGFDDWERFLKNQNLTAALLNKFTANCNLINMLQCKSITPQLISPKK